MALTIRDEAAHADHLERVRVAIEAQDVPALEELGAGARIEPPDGYTLLREHIGTGKTSRVALVRRDRDGQLLAWKIPADDGTETRAHAQASVERSREWVRMGVSNAPVEWAED